MYGLVDSENKLVAYHEFVEPVEIYMDAMNDRDKYNFNIIQILRQPPILSIQNNFYQD